MPIATRIVDAVSPEQSVLSCLADDQIRIFERVPETIDFVDNALFVTDGAELELFGRSSRDIDVPAWVHFPEVPEDSEKTPARKTTLSAKDEERLFLQYNYARFRLSGLLNCNLKRLTAGRIKKMTLWYGRALKIRAKIVRANMALVIAMARRTRIPNVEFTELVSEGNMALLRSVEKFDVARGFKFSTYACRAILKSFNRLATKTGTYRRRFPKEYDPDLERSDWDVRKHDMERNDSIDAVRDILSDNRANLSNVERTVVLERFAILSRGKGKTLAEVGKIVGLTNERVRQIQNIALDKIRTSLDDTFLAA